MTKTLLAFLTVVFFAPLAYAQTDAVDLTATFIAGGVTIDRLVVVQIGGIVLIRGRASDSAKAEEAGRFAVRSGYKRVANLIEIVPRVEDVGIERLARQRLEMARELMDCRFQIRSTEGILRLHGQVTYETQKDFAIHLVGSIDGVKEVQSALTLSAPKSQR